MQTQKIIAHITAWLTDYCRQADMDGFVVGISGGIDSAVTSTLCAQTGLKLSTLNLPIDPHRNSAPLADLHIRWLKRHYPHVQSLSLDLTPAFKSLQNTFPDEIQDALTMANTRSRLRMVALYAWATHHRQLVVGTGNKVEDFGVGFFTKYGDGGVDIAPIADLLKSEVYALGEVLDIADEVMSAAPTDGLWSDNRSDEEQLGATYAELEWAMGYTADRPNEDLPDRQKTVLAIYKRLNRKNRHKMKPIPVCRIPDHLK